MSRFNFSICSCVRPKPRGVKSWLNGFYFWGGELHRGVGVLECECMHVNACVCVCGIWCHANREWWEEVNKQGQEPFRKCVELEMDVDNRSIRVLILLSEASLHFFSCQSVRWMMTARWINKYCPSPKTKHSSKNIDSLPTYWLRNEHCSLLIWFNITGCDIMHSPQAINRTKQADVDFNILPPKAPLGSRRSELSLIDYGHPLPTKILIVLNRKSSNRELLASLLAVGAIFKPVSFHRGWSWSERWKKSWQNKGETGIHWEGSGMWGRCEVPLPTTVFH